MHYTLVIFYILLKGIIIPMVQATEIFIYYIKQKRDSETRGKD